MAVEIQNSVEYANQIAHPPVEMEANYFYGKIRLYRFSFTQNANVGDIASIQKLVRLPAGKINLIGPLSWFKNSAYTATATIDIGWEAYRDKSGAVVAADQDGLVDGHLATASQTVSFTNPTTGVAGVGLATDLTKTFESSSGVVITAQNLVATIPAGATMKGFIAVAVE
jgi:hypothetical protein